MQRVGVGMGVARSQGSELPPPQGHVTDVGVGVGAFVGLGVLVGFGTEGRGHSQGSKQGGMGVGLGVAVGGRQPKTGSHMGMSGTYVSS